MILKEINGKWAILSEKTHRPLAYYKGEGKPTKQWVALQEEKLRGYRPNIKPDILPKSGGGQEGTDTLLKSYQRDTPGQGGDVKKHPLSSFRDYLNNK